MGLRRTSIIRAEVKVKESLGAFAGAAILLILYVTLPTTTKDILSVFSCEQFDMDKHKLRLRADYSIDCDEPKSKAMIIYAAIMCLICE